MTMTNTNDVTPQRRTTASDCDHRYGGDENRRSSPFASRSQRQFRNVVATGCGNISLPNAENGLNTQANDAKDTQEVVTPNYPTPQRLDLRISSSNMDKTCSEVLPSRGNLISKLTLESKNLIQFSLASNIGPILLATLFLIIALQSADAAIDARGGGGGRYSGFGASRGGNRGGGSSVGGARGGGGIIGSNGGVSSGGREGVISGGGAGGVSRQLLVCLKNCVQCKMMYGVYFEGSTCGESCLRFKGNVIPDCNDLRTIVPFLNKLE